MTFPADSGSRQLMSSWTSRIFPLFAWLPQLEQLGCILGQVVCKTMAWPRRALGKQTGGPPAVMISCEPSALQAAGLLRGRRFHISPSLKGKPLLPSAKHVGDHFRSWEHLGILAPGLVSLSSFCREFSPSAQSRASRSFLGSLPGDMEKGTSAGKVNQCDQEHCSPAAQTQSRKPMLGESMRMGWEWGGNEVETLTRNSPEFGVNAHVIISLSAHGRLSKVPVSDVLEFANLYFMFLNTPLE